MESFVDSKLLGYKKEEKGVLKCENGAKLTEKMLWWGGGADPPPSVLLPKDTRGLQVFCALNKQY